MENLQTKEFIKTNSFIEQKEMQNSSELTKENLPGVALSYYHDEKYDLAAAAFEKALELDPSNLQLKEMLQMSRANAIAEVHVPVPDVYYFDREKLLSKPVVADGALPKAHNPAAPVGLFKKMKIRIGNALGSVSTALMGVATKIWGTFARLYQ